MAVNFSTIAELPTYDSTATKAGAKNTVGTSSQDMQDNFLRMLVTQLQNQNPLDPTDTNQFTAQLAQLNMVKSLESLNQKFESFSSQMTAASFVSWTGSVGKSALVPGSTFGFDGENPVNLVGQLKTDAASVVATIVDSQGRIASTVDLGGARSGPLRFNWDGTLADGGAAPPGAYAVLLQAFDAGGAAVDIKPYAPATIAAVSREAGKISVVLDDGRTISDQDVYAWVH